VRAGVGLLTIGLPQLQATLRTRRAYPAAAEIAKELGAVAEAPWAVGRESDTIWLGERATEHNLKRLSGEGELARYKVSILPPTASSPARSWLRSPGRSGLPRISCFAPVDSDTTVNCACSAEDGQSAAVGVETFTRYHGFAHLLSLPVPKRPMLAQLPDMRVHDREPCPTRT
jgi:hypothetical protein